MVSESPGRNMRERRSSLETDSLGGRDSYLMSKTVESVAYWLKRQFPPAGYQRWHGGKDTPSNWRSPPRPIEKSTEIGRLYNLLREISRRREGGGWVCMSYEAR